MRVYYAHNMALYGTPQERRDIALLEALGFTVCNPSDPAIIETVRSRKELEQDYWDIFEYLIERCAALAYRALPSGMIPAGISKEIDIAIVRGLPVIELPWGHLPDRTLSVEATRAYLREVGQR